MIGPLIDLLFPKECHICGRKLRTDESHLCIECAGKLPATLYHRYWQGPGTMNPMEERIAGVIPFRHATAAWFYRRESPLAAVVADFKYRGFRRLAMALGEHMAADLLYSGIFDGVDVIVPVPLHFTKQARRGYSQTAMIARGVSRQTGIPVCHDLRAIRRHRTQTSLTPEERRKNTQGVFRMRNPSLYDGMHLLVIDDICTTGSTLMAVGEAVLRDIPGARLSFLTLGVTY